jgi:hypothetical protein
VAASEANGVRSPTPLYPPSLLYSTLLLTARPQGRHRRERGQGGYGVDARLVLDKSKRWLARWVKESSGKEVKLSVSRTTGSAGQLHKVMLFPFICPDSQIGCNHAKSRFRHLSSLTLQELLHCHSWIVSWLEILAHTRQICCADA